MFKFIFIFAERDFWAFTNILHLDFKKTRDVQKNVVVKVD